MENRWTLQAVAEACDSRMGREIAAEVRSGQWSRAGNQFSTIVTSLGEIAQACRALRELDNTLAGLGTYANGGRIDIGNAIDVLANELRDRATDVLRDADETAGE